jgi:hypothetical protein
MKSILTILSVIFALCNSGLAYNELFLIEIVSIEAKDNGQYRMEYLQRKSSDGKELENGPKRAVIHLRYNENIFGEGTAYTSRKKFEESIKILEEHAKKKEEVLFGEIANGIILIDADKNEYQSNSLSPIRLASGKFVVVSYGHKIQAEQAAP